MTTVWHHWMGDEPFPEDEYGGGHLSSEGRARLGAEQKRFGQEFHSRVVGKTPGPGSPTTYAMVPTGRVLHTGTRNPQVSSYVADVLRPAIVDVASAVTASVGRMLPHQRTRVANGLEKFGNAMDEMVSRLHQGQNGSAVAGGAKAVNGMLEVTSDLQMSDATNALLDMNAVLSPEAVSGLGSV